MSNSSSLGGFSGILYLYNPSNTATFTQVTWSGVKADDGAGKNSFAAGVGARKNAADVDALRFIYTSGNIASGEFELYGVI
jgi:hypothetical protein